jgi:catechol 2,3-dioxygenase-like lactoylglutathione lyase family enzyme
MEISKIKETCLYINDVESSYDFYHDILGFECISKVTGRHVFFRVGDGVLLCFLPEITKNEKELPPHFATGPQHVAFEVDTDNYDKVKSGLKKKGVQITHTQKWSSGMYESFYFEDPSENVLEIVMNGMWD